MALLHVKFTNCLIMIRKIIDMNKILSCTKIENI